MLGLMEEFKKIVLGFADSLVILHKHQPERVKEKKSFSIKSLVEDLLPGEDISGLHNAVDDVIILRKIMDCCQITDPIIKNFAKSICTIIQEEANKPIISSNKASLQAYSGNISANLIKKMSEAGINKDMLDEAYANDGDNGIRLLLGESVNGKARVTNSKKILEKICAIFTKK